MAKTTAVYDGYVFDFDIPHNRHVTGQEIKEAMTRELGRPLVGAPAIQRPDGNLEHIDVREPVRVSPDDRIIVTPTFETAAALSSPGR